MPKILLDNRLLLDENKNIIDDALKLVNEWVAKGFIVQMIGSLKIVIPGAKINLLASKIDLESFDLTFLSNSFMQPAPSAEWWQYLKGFDLEKFTERRKK